MTYSTGSGCRGSCARSDMCIQSRDWQTADRRRHDDKGWDCTRSPDQHNSRLRTTQSTRGLAV